MKPGNPHPYSTGHACTRRRGNPGRRLAATLLLCSLTQLPVQAMSRWAALSQLESGNNDGAVGAVGEISRYQIRPEIWVRYALPYADWQAPAEALVVAKKVMQDRCADFRRRFHKSPNDFEFYLLWNAPAQVQRPSSVVRQRAERFCRLVQKAEPGMVLTSR